MEILIEGSRSSSENWMLAHAASPNVLPALNEAQKNAADELGIGRDAYARSLYAGDLTRMELGAKAKCAARIIERMVQAKVPGVVLDSVWLRTFAGKLRFDLDLNRSHATIWLNEDVLDEFLESGSRTAEEQISRIVESGLPSDWTAKAS